MLHGFEEYIKDAFLYSSFKVDAKACMYSNIAFCIIY